MEMRIKRHNTLLTVEVPAANVATVWRQFEAARQVTVSDGTCSFPALIHRFGRVVDGDPAPIDLFQSGEMSGEADFDSFAGAVLITTNQRQRIAARVLSREINGVSFDSEAAKDRNAERSTGKNFANARPADAVVEASCGGLGPVATSFGETLFPAICGHRPTPPLCPSCLVAAAANAINDDRKTCAMVGHLDERLSGRLNKIEQRIAGIEAQGQPAKASATEGELPEFAKTLGEVFRLMREARKGGAA